MCHFLSDSENTRQKKLKFGKRNADWSTSRIRSEAVDRPVMNRNDDALMKRERRREGETETERAKKYDKNVNKCQRDA